MDRDEEAGRENSDVDEFVCADLDDVLPFDDASVDLVYANFVVEHLGRPERTFSEWRRILKPGGRLVLLTTNRANPVMAAASLVPERARLAIKRRGAGVVARDVYPAHYRANTPARLAAVAGATGFQPVAFECVATLHRYGERVPGAPTALRTLERLLPAERRSTIVASYA